jgi:hypothetical protein
MTVLDGVVALAAAATVTVLNPTGTVETVWAGSAAARQKLTTNAAVREFNGRMGWTF